MKKIVSLLLAVVMLCTVASFITVSAADDNVRNYTYPTTAALIDEFKKMPDNTTVNIYGPILLDMYDALTINSENCTVNFYNLEFFSHDCKTRFILVNEDNVTLNFYDCNIRTTTGGEKSYYYKSTNEYGSAIYVYGVNCTINGHGTTVFDHCQTGGYYGGAIYVGRGCTNCRIRGCTFQDCESTGSHGDTGEGNSIYVAPKGCVISDCKFDGFPSAMRNVVYSWKEDTKIINCTPNQNLSYSIYNTWTYPYCTVLNTSAADIEEGNYIIRSALNESLSVDIDGGVTATNPGAISHLWQDGQANIFSVTKNKDKDNFVMKSMTTGFVLDTGKDGAANVIQSKDENAPSQRWVFEDAGDGYYYIRSEDKQYLTVYDAKPDNGSWIVPTQLTCDKNQKFKLERRGDAIKSDDVKSVEIEEGDYIIYTKLNDKLSLDIEGGNYSVGVGSRNVHLWENGEANVFTVTKDKSKNAYSIRSKVTGLVVDIAGGSKDNGTNIQQWADNGSDPQRWVFETTGNGYYYIRSLNGKYMTVWQSNASSGGNIASYQFVGADNQMFKLVKANSNVGSVLSEGNLWIVIAVAVLGIIAIAALVIVKKKKKD